LASSGAGSRPAAGALGVDDSEEEDDVSILMFLAGSDGQPYPYVVAGVVGKHLSSPEAVALDRFLQQAAAAKNPDTVTILGEPMSPASGMGPP
jgi:hypothetical protein